MCRCVLALWCVRTCVRPCTSGYVHACVCPCGSACLCVRRACTWVRVCARVGVRPCTRGHVHVCVRTRLCVPVHAYVRLCTHPCDTIGTPFSPLWVERTQADYYICMHKIECAPKLEWCRLQCHAYYSFAIQCTFCNAAMHSLKRIKRKLLTTLQPGRIVRAKLSRPNYRAPKCPRPIVMDPSEKI